MSSQQIGIVNNGDHSLKLLKTDHLFACFYSDIKENSYAANKSFKFSNKDFVYEIMMNGFNNKDHQIFVQTNKDTIVKFEYKKVNGRWMLKIRQNNLDTKTTSISTFFYKEQIEKLFGYL
jgi:hypothetical protein